MPQSKISDEAMRALDKQRNNVYNMNTRLLKFLQVRTREN